MRLIKLFLIISLILVSSFNGYCQVDQEDIVFGKHRIIHSDILDQDRVLYINLPQAYEESDEAYPVVFQLYAHFKENYYLPTLRTSTLLGAYGASPNMIVVGIMNREFRYRDLLPVDHWGGKSEIENFTNFFREELIPFLEKEYRVQDYRILSGPQAGAAFGIYSLSNNPDLFNAYILGSPFWIANARQPLLDVFSEGMKKHDYSNKFLMISYGHQEGEAEIDAIEEFATLARKVDAPGFRFVLNKYQTDFGFTSPMDIEKGLKTLYSDYQFPFDQDLHPLEDIEKHFNSQSEYFGFDIRLPEVTLAKEGDKFLAKEDLAPALKIYLKMHELYPDGLMGYDRLGEVFRKKGNLKKSIKYYKGFLKYQPDNPRILGIIEEMEKGMK